MAGATPSAADELCHEAVIYGSEAELLDRLLPFVEDGLRDDEPVYVVARRQTLDLLRAAAGRDFDRVAGVTPSERWWRGGPVTLQAYDEGIRQLLADGARRVRVVGEPVWLADGRRGRQWRRYEAVANLHFAGLPVDILCLHDARTLGDDILADVARTHPFVTADGDTGESDAFVDPRAFVMGIEDETVGTQRSSDIEEHTVGSDVESAKSRFRSRAVDAGLAERVDDLELAFGELLANATSHGRPPVTVRYCTPTPARGLVSEVCDSGPGITDPLAGYAPWNSDHPGGRGLWLARQFADDLVARNTGSGTVVTMVALAAADAAD